MLYIWGKSRHDTRSPNVPTITQNVWVLLVIITILRMKGRKISPSQIIFDVIPCCPTDNVTARDGYVLLEDEYICKSRLKMCVKARKRERECLKENVYGGLNLLYHSSSIYELDP